MKVLKFGGTSMGDEHTWRRVLKILSRYNAAVVVVSATARTTRLLVAAAEKAQHNLDQAKKIAEKIKERHQTLVQSFLENTGNPEKDVILKTCMEHIIYCIDELNELLQEVTEKGSLSPKTRDAIASIGEQLSAHLFAQCGRAYGLETRWINARSIIKTDADFGKATPDQTEIARNVSKIEQAVNDGFVPIVGGFYGENEKGEITTLGFEGSDYTASLLAAALHAQAIEIWTDVSGIYTCDPGTVKEARPIPELSFQEATELAYFGAKVLHPSTMKPAAAKNIPVFVKNIFAPGHPGTKIHGEKKEDGRAKAITYLNGIAILTITSNGSLMGHRFLAHVFSLLDAHHISVNAVTTTEASVSVALHTNFDMQMLQRDFEDIGTVNRNPNQGLISLIGCRLETAASITEYIFSAIPETKPSLVSYSRTKQNLNIAVSEAELIPAVCEIHDSIFGEGG